MCGVLMLLHSLAVSARGGGGWLEAAAAGEQQIQNTRSYDRNITTQQAGKLNFEHFGEGQRILKIRTGDEVTTRRRTLLFPLPGDAIQFV